MQFELRGEGGHEFGVRDRVKVGVVNDPAP